MKQWLTLGVLVLFAVGSYFLMRDLQQSLAPKPPAAVVKEIAVAYTTKGYFYDANNALKYEIDSESVHEYSNAGGSKLFNANVRALDTQQALAWTAHAQRADLSADRNVLDLTGGVELIQTPNSPDPVRASSERMTYYAQKQRVVGDQPLVIESRATQQTAGSFYLDMAKKTVHFQNGVHVSHSVYQPPATDALLPMSTSLPSNLVNSPKTLPAD